MGDNLEVKNATPNVPTDEGNKNIVKKISPLPFIKVKEFQKLVTSPYNFSSILKTTRS